MPETPRRNGTKLSTLEQKIQWLLSHRIFLVGKLDIRKIALAMKHDGLLSKTTYWPDAKSGINTAIQQATRRWYAEHNGRGNRAVTTPDTLASLIAKWRNQALNAKARGDGDIASYCNGHADELEAALDALVERLERYSQIQSNRAVAEAYLACAAELRGTASET